MKRVYVQYTVERHLERRPPVPESEGANVMARMMDRALERWRALTPPLSPFPLRCGYCAKIMTDDDKLSVFETPAVQGFGARVMHTKCYRRFRQSDQRGDRR